MRPLSALMERPTTVGLTRQSTAAVDLALPAREQPGALGLLTEALQVEADELHRLERQRRLRSPRAAVRGPLIRVRGLGELLGFFRERPVDERLGRREVPRSVQD